MIGFAQAREGLQRMVRRCFRPIERLSPSQQCEKYLSLPPGKNESKPGKVRFNERPFLREPIDAAAEPGVTDVVLVGPTRLGKTFILRMLFAWSIAFDPAPAMWVDTTIDTARRVSKKELRPLVEYNACLRSRKPGGPNARHLFTDLAMHFPGAAFGMVGANSDNQVAGDTVTRVFGNEVGKWRGATEKDANIQEQVRHRTEAADEDRFHFWSCTPDLEQGLTWQLAQKGDLRKWFAVCPRCMHAQELVWGEAGGPAGVWWPSSAKSAEGKWDLVRVKREARYRCTNAACTANHGPTGWDDLERRDAVQNAEARGGGFRPTKAPDVPGWRSYHVNGLYGPLSSNDVGELAVDFLSARSNGFWTTRQDFWNSRMGMPWLDTPSDLNAQKFVARERWPIGNGQFISYLRGEVPDGWKPDGFILGYDIQNNRFEWGVSAFDWSGRMVTVDHGACAGWKDLDRIQDDYAKKFLCTSFAIGDVNFEERRAEALEQIFMRRDRGWFAADGFEVAAERVKIEKANVYAGGKLGVITGPDNKPLYTVPKLVISLYEFKVEVEKRFTGEIANWFTYSLPLAATDAEREEQAELYRQFLDERRRPRKVRRPGKPPFEFVSRTHNNHAFDWLVYTLALFWTLQKSYSAAAKKKSATREVMTVKR